MTFIVGHVLDTVELYEFSLYHTFKRNLFRVFYWCIQLVHLAVSVHVTVQSMSQKRRNVAFRNVNQ